MFSSHVFANSTSSPFFAGDRQGCRRFIEETLTAGVSATDLLNHLIWPTMELLQSLYREDRVTIGSLNLATRLNRSITDQLCAKLPAGRFKGPESPAIFCGDRHEPEGAGRGRSALPHLFESDGYTVKFAGGGVPEDEVLQLIGDERPDLLMLFGTLPSGVPAVPAAHQTTSATSINSCPVDADWQCCCGIYRRAAEGLAEEISARPLCTRCGNGGINRQRPSRPQGDGRSTDGGPDAPHPQGRGPKTRARREIRAPRWRRRRGPSSIGQWSVVSCQWSVVSGQLSVVSCELVARGCLGPVDRSQLSEISLAKSDARNDYRFNDLYN